MPLEALIFTTLSVFLLILCVGFFLLRGQLVRLQWQQQQYLTTLTDVSQSTSKLQQLLQTVDTHSSHNHASVFNELTQLRQSTEKALSDFKEAMLADQHQFRQNFDKHQFENFKTLHETWQTSSHNLQLQLTEALNQHAKMLDSRVEKLTEETGMRLKEISGQVEKRLAEGFEKTNATFTDVVKRLALIDVAQQKITELSSNVVSLQEVLSDKRSRGAFGEVQLSALVRNVMPENSFQFQATLSNSKRVDCLLYLPDPTGNVAIDSKFPLENFRNMTNIALPDSERKAAEQLFRQDIRKHIQDISEKYIIAGETSDGAIMFIPAESIFAEIHSQYPDLVDIANRARVWLASPTTMMAILTTARSVLKDVATRKQIHIIQEHLRFLATDFSRFQDRMEKLGKHIEQAHNDVKDVQTSAKKIHSRFDKIEKVEIEDTPEARKDMLTASEKSALSQEQEA